ncbi:hypothetical protein BSK59_15520 [Paenibacillus odorifer]|uniref:hypothetical protein n=1 Tax=Paenibacillus odorifer TaxID=189426 RepID=UPI00096C35A4|nr:hypothetical protein [Paenibacillus odorifer]OME53988.1 hypothetical protein BSK59_15520 [Paenibacillus odorifer]
MKNVLRTIPVLFEKVDQIDTRFQKVKIWLMHLGQNYNNSIFTRESVEDAMETLKNTPILGFVEESRLGDKDFRGHEVELVVEGGELKTKYIGQAFGLIPESCNPRFETKKGDFDNDLEYLVVDGLMWTKLDDGVNILNTHGEVSQSMELHDDYDGYFNEEDVFVFTRFSFYGACLLGQDVLPAMQKATVEVSFSANVNVYQEEIARKLEEYQIAFSKKQNKEVEQDMTLEQLLAKYSTNAESLAEMGVEVTSFSIEDLEAKLEEMFATGQENGEGELPATQMEGEGEAVVDGEGSVGEGEPEGDSEGEPQSDPEPEFLQEGEGVNEPEKFTVTFELSHDDIRSQMWSQIDTHMSESGITDSWFYISKVYDSHVIVESDGGDRFYKVGYARENDVISFSDVAEVHPMFLTTDEKGALELMRSSFVQYEKENTELKDFQSKVLKGQHEALADEVISQFDKLTVEDVAEIRENVHDFTIEQIESKCFELVGRKTTKFSTPKTSQSYSMKIGVNPNQESANPNSYAHLFKKHGLA